MPVYRPRTLRTSLIICLALAGLLCGLSASALADVINFKKLLPFVDIKIPGWTMEGQPSGFTVGPGPMNVSETRPNLKPAIRS